MAKPQFELINKPSTIEYRSPDTKQCVCGHNLTRGEHESIESGVLKGRFCGTSCLVRADGARWIGCTIIDYLGNTYSEEKYLKVMEVIAC